MMQLAPAEEGRRTIAAIFTAGVEFLGGMRQLVDDELISGANFTAIGALERVRPGTPVTSPGRSAPCSAGRTTASRCTAAVVSLR